MLREKWRTTACYRVNFWYFQSVYLNGFSFIPVLLTSSVGICPYGSSLVHIFLAHIISICRPHGSLLVLLAPVIATCPPGSHYWLLPYGSSLLPVLLAPNIYACPCGSYLVPSRSSLQPVHQVRIIGSCPLGPFFGTFPSGSHYHWRLSKWLIFSTCPPGSLLFAEAGICWTSLFCTSLTRNWTLEKKFFFNLTEICKTFNWIIVTLSIELIDIEGSRR